MPSSDGERERESGGERQIKRREDPGVWESEGCETPTDGPTPFVLVFLERLLKSVSVKFWFSAEIGLRCLQEKVGVR